MCIFLSLASPSLPYSISFTNLIYSFDVCSFAWIWYTHHHHLILRRHILSTNFNKLKIYTTKINFLCVVSTNRIRFNFIEWTKCFFWIYFEFVFLIQCVNQMETTFPIGEKTNSFVFFSCNKHYVRCGVLYRWWWILRMRP